MRDMKDRHPLLERFRKAAQAARDEAAAGNLSPAQSLTDPQARLLTIKSLFEQVRRNAVKEVFAGVALDKAEPIMI